MSLEEEIHKTQVEVSFLPGITCTIKRSLHDFLKKHFVYFDRQAAFPTCKDATYIKDDIVTNEWRRKDVDAFLQFMETVQEIAGDKTSIMQAQYDQAFRNMFSTPAFTGCVWYAVVQLCAYFLPTSPFSVIHLEIPNVLDLHFHHVRLTEWHKTVTHYGTASAWKRFWKALDPKHALGLISAFQSVQSTETMNRWIDGLFHPAAMRHAALLNHPILNQLMLIPYERRSMLTYHKELQYEKKDEHFHIIRSNTDEPRYAFPSMSLTQKRLDEWSGGLIPWLDRHYKWEPHVVLAGGFLSQCLMLPDELNTQGKAIENMDLDFWILGGKTPLDAYNFVQHVLRFFESKQHTWIQRVTSWFIPVKKQQPLFTMRGHVLTLQYPGYPRTIQIVFVGASIASPLMLLQSFDLTHVQWCYQHGKLYGTPLAYDAYLTRRSLSIVPNLFGLRLHKALRRGYNVYIPKETIYEEVQETPKATVFALPLDYDFKAVVSLLTPAPDQVTQDYKDIKLPQVKAEFSRTFHYIATSTLCEINCNMNCVTVMRAVKTVNQQMKGLLVDMHPVGYDMDQSPYIDSVIGITPLTFHVPEMDTDSVDKYMSRSLSLHTTLSEHEHFLRFLEKLEKRLRELRPRLRSHLYFTWKSDIQVDDEDSEKPFDNSLEGLRPGDKVGLRYIRWKESEACHVWKNHKNEPMDVNSLEKGSRVQAWVTCFLSANFQINLWATKIQVMTPVTVRKKKRPVFMSSKDDDTEEEEEDDNPPVTKRVYAYMSTSCST